MIELPWPDSILSPNARPHFRAKAKAVKAHRSAAYWLTQSVMHLRKMPVAGDIAVSLVFHPPSRRRFDLDGLISRTKPYLDGIADALCVDDHRFTLSARRAEPVKGGLVIVEVAG